jgi:hypothetical protein
VTPLYMAIKVGSWADMLRSIGMNCYHHCVTIFGVDALQPKRSRLPSSTEARLLDGEIDYQNRSPSVPICRCDVSIVQVEMLILLHGAKPEDMMNRPQPSDPRSTSLLLVPLESLSASEGTDDCATEKRVVARSTRRQRQRSLSLVRQRWELSLARRTSMTSNPGRSYCFRRQGDSI